MKKVNKKVLKVVEHVMRNEAVYGIDRFPPANISSAETSDYPEEK
mgnify:CR=1 FL=1